MELEVVVQRELVANEATPRQVGELMKKAREKNPRGLVIFNIGSGGRAPFATKVIDTVFNIDPEERGGRVETGLNQAMGTYYATEGEANEVADVLPADKFADVVALVAPNPRDLFRTTLLEDLRRMVGPKTVLLVVLETESGEITRLKGGIERVQDQLDQYFPNLHEYDSLVEALRVINRTGRVNTRMSYAEDTEEQFLILGNR